MDKKELSKILEGHSRWLNGDGCDHAILRRADLMGADLRGADLRRADLMGAILRRADLRRADLRRANLMYANLMGANLMGANLGGANLGGVVGDGEGIKSIFIERYPVAYTPEYLQIGCECHGIPEWMGFDDERILEMDGDTALAWWKKYKGFIKQAIELSPAT